MNPYVVLGTGIGTSEAASLSGRLATWHDAMVTHERALRAGRSGVACDDECPHVEAGMLWSEAVSTYGERAPELAFLRSRATGAMRPAPDAVPPVSASSMKVADHARPSRRRIQRETDDRADPSVTIEPASSDTTPAETWT